MTDTSPPLRLGFFTRVLDEAPPAERYRLALEQVQHAERLGFDSAWVAQHHFHESEGGLPAPLVFLAHAAARTDRIRLGTGIITLPLELPLRVAEDTAVLDLLSGGRLEVGVGAGGNLSAFRAFDLDVAERAALYASHLAMLRGAWTGNALPGGDRLYPLTPGLNQRVWQATFTAEGGRRAGQDGDGLLLSRTQPKSGGITLNDIQTPIVDTYLDSLPQGRAPRILASRSVFVADDRRDALRLAELGLARARARPTGPPVPGSSLAEWIALSDIHIGTPEEVIASLRRDAALARATDLAVQVHPVDPPHAMILRSMELVAERVAPALGWRGQTGAAVRRVA